MEIFSNPMFQEPQPEEDPPDKPQPSPRNSTNSLLHSTRDSVSSFLNKFKGKKDKTQDPLKEKDLISNIKGLEAIEEGTLPLEEKNNVSLIESESEVSKLRYENSLLVFNNKELVQRLEELSGEQSSLKELLKLSDETLRELQGKLTEEETNRADLVRDLERLDIDNRRLLELEGSLKVRNRELEGEVEEKGKALKEKDDRIKGFEEQIRDIKAKYIEEIEKVKGFYEEQIESYKEKSLSLENTIRNTEKKEAYLDELQSLLEKEKKGFQESLILFEETLSSRDNRIQELQTSLSQKEEALLSLEGNKSNFHLQQEEKGQELKILQEELLSITETFHNKELALLQENRELLDLLDGKRAELQRKEEAFEKELKTLENEVISKDQALYQEKESLCEERMKLSNERLELEQNIRKLQGETLELKEEINTLKNENLTHIKALEVLEEERKVLLDEKSGLEQRLMEEKTKELSIFSSDLEAKSQSMGIKLEEMEIETLVLKEKLNQSESQVSSLKGQYETLCKENEMLVKQLLAEKSLFQKEKTMILEQKRSFEQNYRSLSGSIHEKETMIQDLMGSLLEKESYIRNSVLEKDSELMKLKENYEAEIGFYKKSESEKAQIYENLMNKLVQGEKLLQTKQSTLAYFQENYQKVLKEKDQIEEILKRKEEALSNTTINLESSKLSLVEFEKKLKENSRNLETLNKEIQKRAFDKEDSIKKMEETFDLKLKAEKGVLDSKLREKEVETLHLRQELNKTRLSLEEKTSDLSHKTLRLEQEYQNKLIELSKSTETLQKESLRKLEEILDKKGKDLSQKEKRVIEVEDLLKQRDREIRELKEGNRELQEKVAGFLKEKEAFLRDNALVREQKLRGFETRMQEMQVRFSGEIENLSLQKLRIREEYEIKLENKLKEISELKSIRKGLEEKVLLANKDKELALKEVGLIKEKWREVPGGVEDRGLIKELRIENRLLQEEKKKILEDYEGRIKGLEGQLVSLKEEKEKEMEGEGEGVVREEKVKRGENNSRKKMEFRKRGLFKESEVLADVSHLEEKVKRFLFRYCIFFIIIVINILINN